MTAIDGFILTMFPPVAIMTMLGSFFVFWKYPHEKQQSLPYFLVWVFLIMLCWRIPIVIDRRYMLPVIVPGILLAALFLRTLFHKWHYIGKWLCGVLLTAMAIAGTAKAMRFQEPKPYLVEIPTVVNEELQDYKWEQTYVMILGNIGGYLPFSDSVTSRQILVSSDFSAKDDHNQIFEQIDLYFKPNNLLLQYPAIYILITSYLPSEDFIRIWHSKYGHTPVLCYEFIRPKNKERIQLFRIESSYSSANKTNKERLASYKNFNLLPNPDFSQKTKLPPDAPVFAKLASLGIDLGIPAGETSFPDDWKLYMPSIKKEAQISFKYSERGNLSLSGQDTIVFIQDAQPLAGGKIYQLNGRIILKQKSYFFIDVQRKGGKWSIFRIYTMNSQPGRYEFSGLIDLSDKPGLWNINWGITGGDIELESLYLVDQAVFENQQNHN